MGDSSTLAGRYDLFSVHLATQRGQLCVVPGVYLGHTHGVDGFAHVLWICGAAQHTCREAGEAHALTHERVDDLCGRQATLRRYDGDGVRLEEALVAGQRPERLVRDAFGESTGERSPSNDTSWPVELCHRFCST